MKRCPMAAMVQAALPCTARESADAALSASAPAEARSPAERHAEILVRNGAVLTLAGAPLTLVGHWEWLADGCVFCFPAFGDSERDARTIEFDETRDLGDAGICFLNARAIVGELTSVASARVDDPDDYRVAWQLWQQVKPLRMRFISRCLAAHAAAAFGTPHSR